MTRTMEKPIKDSSTKVVQRFAQLAHSPADYIHLSWPEPTIFQPAVQIIKSFKYTLHYTEQAGSEIAN